jgi:ADP-ribose pyrophosphatase YjhB (NUDIX family)
MLRVPNLPEKEFRKLLKITPMIGVDVIIVNSKGEFLLEKRTYPPKTGCWHLPGGFTAYKERLADTAVRKAREETGLKVKVLKFVGYYDDPKLDPRGSIIVFAFTAKPMGGKMKEEGLKWFKNMPGNMGFKHQIKALKGAGLVI